MNSSPHRFRRYLTITVVSGIMMILSPMIGLAGTIAGLVGAFETVETSRISDPGRLSENIGEVLISTATGFVVALIGLPFFAIFLALTLAEHSRLKRRHGLADGTVAA